MTMNRWWSLTWAGCLIFLAARARGEDVTIRIDARGPGRPVSRLLTGACIEDVNHEIYGGLYSQMLFGESFQEPPRRRWRDSPPSAGSGTRGTASSRARPGAGPKLVADGPTFADGEVGVEVFLPRDLRRQRRARSSRSIGPAWGPMRSPATRSRWRRRTTWSSAGTARTGSRSAACRAPCRATAGSRWSCGLDGGFPGGAGRRPERPDVPRMPSTRSAPAASGCGRGSGPRGSATCGSRRARPTGRSPSSRRRATRPSATASAACGALRRGLGAGRVRARHARAVRRPAKPAADVPRRRGGGRRREPGPQPPGPQPRRGRAVRGLRLGPGGPADVASRWRWRAATGGGSSTRRASR